LKKVRGDLNSPSHRPARQLAADAVLPITALSQESVNSVYVAAASTLDRNTNGCEVVQGN